MSPIENLLGHVDEDEGVAFNFQGLKVVDSGEEESLP